MLCSFLAAATFTARALVGAGEEGWDGAFGDRAKEECLAWWLTGAGAAIGFFRERKLGRGERESYLQRVAMEERELCQSDYVGVRKEKPREMKGQLSCASFFGYGV